MSATFHLLLSAFLAVQQGELPASRPVESMPTTRPIASVLPFAKDAVDGHIAAGELYAHVAHLASDRLNGRHTGSKGGILAAQYLASELKRLKKMGLQPAGDDLPGGGKSFLQNVHLPGLSFSALPTMSAIGGELLEYGSDFELRAGFGFAGTLKVVACADASALPAQPQRGAALYFDMFASKARRAMMAKGDEWKAGWGAIIERGSRSPGRRLTDAARIVRVRGPKYPLIFEVSGLGRGMIEANIGKHIELAVGGKTRDAYNVVALLPANTRPSKDSERESVVISAHYDHLRPRDVASGKDGIFNGADDDASGVAAVIEITEALCFSDAPRDRDLVVLLATGEEIGLVGTVYYIEHPVKPLASTTANLNFEMLGRVDELVGGTGKLWLTGYQHTNLGAELAVDGAGVVLDPRPEQYFFERSDNYAFVLKGIIGQSLSSYNLHSDYHRVSDEADTLDYDHLASAAQIGLSAVHKLLDGEFQIAWTPGYTLPRR